VIIAADNINGLNPIIARALDELNPKPIEELVKQCEQAGAQIMDVNPGHLSRRKEDRMRFLVETVQKVTSKYIMLDSPNPRLIEIGLSVCTKPPILNALSLEGTKLTEILPMAVKHDTDVVGLLMDERSFTPPSAEEKIALAIELRERAIEAGLPTDKLIYDPVMPNLSWDDVYARIAEAIKTVRFLSSGAIFQEPARTMAGLSNLRSGLRHRYPWSIDEMCLGMLTGAGLEYILADVLSSEFQKSIELINRFN
jgi:5-methyltetrahydrofolate corrinoid/iron sulfur protein methyltransferase